MYKIIWKIEPKNISKKDIKIIEEKLQSYCVKNQDLGGNSKCGEYDFNYKIDSKENRAEITYITKYKYFDWSENFKQDEKILFVNAKEDFVNYLVLNSINGFGGGGMGTSIWFPHQSIEKFFKALLLKSGKFSIKELHGHNLIDLFEKYENNKPESLIFKNEKYKILIEELNSGGKNAGLKYFAGIRIKEPFTRLFIEFCTILIYDFLSLDELLKSNSFGFGTTNSEVLKILNLSFKKYITEAEVFLNNLLINKKKETYFK